MPQQTLSKMLRSPNRELIRRKSLEQRLKETAEQVSLTIDGAWNRDLEYVVSLADLARQINEEIERVADDLRLEKLKK